MKRPCGAVWCRHQQPRRPGEAADERDQEVSPAAAASTASLYPKFFFSMSDIIIFLSCSMLASRSTYILPFFGGGFHDIRKPSPLAHGIGVGDGLEGRVLAFEDAGAADTSSPAQVSSSEFHLVHDVLHVQVHVEGYQSNTAAGQLDRVVTTCSEKNYRWYKLFCKKRHVCQLSYYYYYSRRRRWHSVVVS